MYFLNQDLPLIANKQTPRGTMLTFNVIGFVCVLRGGRGKGVGGRGRVGAEITVNVTPAPLSIIHFQSIAVLRPVRQLGDDASKMGSIA